MKGVRRLVIALLFATITPVAIGAPELPRPSFHHAVTHAAKPATKKAKKAKKTAAHSAAKGARSAKRAKVSTAANLLTNGSFEGSLAGWSGYQARLSLVRDGSDGSDAAKVTALEPSTSYAIDTRPYAVASTTAGTTYAASGSARSDHRLAVCLRVREWSAGSVLGSAQKCVSGSTSWQSFPTLAYTTIRSGDTLDLYAYAANARSGDSFEVDGLTLSVLHSAASPVTPPTTTPPTTTPPVTTPPVTTPPSTTPPASGGSGSGGSTGGSGSGGTSGGGSSGGGSSSTSTCTRYASPSGSDSAAGTSGAPFRTGQRLVSSLAAGQTGCLEAGTYTGDITISTGGQAGLPVTLQSADGVRATVRGKIWVTNAANYVVVSNLFIDNPIMGVSDVLVEGDQVTLSDNEMTSDNTGICVLLGGDDGTAVATTMSGNRIHNCGPLPATNHGHGIYVEHTVNAKIVGNWIYDNADRGIQLYPDAQGTLIANNVIDGNGEGIIFSGDSSTASSNNTVEDNIITNSVIRSNVESYWEGPIGTNNVAQNNCLWNGAEGNVSPQSGFTASNNVVADPLYTNLAAHDFQLLPGSPCAGMGPQ